MVSCGEGGGLLLTPTRCMHRCLLALPAQHYLMVNPLRYCTSFHHSAHYQKTTHMQRVREAIYNGELHRAPSEHGDMVAQAHTAQVLSPAA